MWTERYPQSSHYEYVQYQPSFVTDFPIIPNHDTSFLSRYHFSILIFCSIMNYSTYSVFLVSCHPSKVTAYSMFPGHLRILPHLVCHFQRPSIMLSLFRISNGRTTSSLSNPNFRGLTSEQRLLPQNQSVMDRIPLVNEAQRPTPLPRHWTTQIL